MPTNEPRPVTPDPDPTAEPNDFIWNGEPFWLTYKGHNIHIEVYGTGASERIRIETSRHGEAAEDPFDDATVYLPGA